MTRVQSFILALALFMTAACSSTDTEQFISEETSEQTESAAPQSTGKSATPRSTSSDYGEAPPAPSKPKYVSLNAGTIIPIRLLDPLNSSINQTGDTFRAVVDANLLVNNQVIFPRGSQAIGKLTLVQRSGRVKGVAMMSMTLESLQVGNSTYPLKTGIRSFEAETTKKEDAAKVGIGSGIGAVVGAIAGGGKGAAIGAAVGAGAGGATVAATRGKELKFEVEHPIEFTMNESVSIQIE